MSEFAHFFCKKFSVLVLAVGSVYKKLYIDFKVKPKSKFWNYILLFWEINSTASSLCASIILKVEVAQKSYLVCNKIVHVAWLIANYLRMGKCRRLNVGVGIVISKSGISYMRWWFLTKHFYKFKRARRVE